MNSVTDWAQPDSNPKKRLGRENIPRRLFLFRKEGDGKERDNALPLLTNLCFVLIRKLIEKTAETESSFLNYTIQNRFEAVVFPPDSASRNDKKQSLDPETVLHYHEAVIPLLDRKNKRSGQVR